MHSQTGKFGGRILCCLPCHNPYYHTHTLTIHARHLIAYRDVIEKKNGLKWFFFNIQVNISHGSARVVTGVIKINGASQEISTLQYSLIILPAKT